LPCELKGRGDMVRGAKPVPIPVDIGARLNDVRGDSITELLRVENETPLPPPLLMRYGMKPPKLPA
jgi:hypothetical protein